MNYEDEMMRYEDDAEDQYDNYYEDEYYEDEDNFDTGFEGNEDAYYGEEVAMYDDYSASSIGMIDANDRTLTVVVRNTTQQAETAIIFGGNEEAPQPAGLTVTVEESSHREVREESKANPFKIAGMKMSVSNPLQFDNVLQILRRTATGSNTSRVYQPRNATSPQNFTQQLIDDEAFEMDVTGQDSLRLMIEPDVTVVFTLTVKARANIGNLLDGRNVAELSRSPRTTGLPQLDLLRKRRPTAFGIRPRAKRKVKRPMARPAMQRPPARLLRRR